MVHVSLDTAWDKYTECFQEKCGLEHSSHAYSTLGSHVSTPSGVACSSPPICLVEHEQSEADHEEAMFPGRGPYHSTAGKHSWGNRLLGRRGQECWAGVQDKDKAAVDSVSNRDGGGSSKLLGQGPLVLSELDGGQVLKLSMEAQQSCVVIVLDRSPVYPTVPICKRRGNGVLERIKQQHMWGAMKSNFLTNFAQLLSVVTLVKSPVLSLLTLKSIPPCFSVKSSEST